MKLDQKDIEAIAKARLNRKQGKQTSYWTWAALLLFVLGYAIVAFMGNTVGGIVVIAAGFIAFVYYHMFRLPRLQNDAKTKLLKEWREEVGK